jgi:hypothetical protein
MALLYPWATKEYLLWEMSLGQIILYFNLGMDTKYPPEKKEGVLANKSHAQLKALRDELRQLGLAEKQEKEQKQEEQKKALAEKYGNI